MPIHSLCALHNTKFVSASADGTIKLWSIMDYDDTYDENDFCINANTEAGTTRGTKKKKNRNRENEPWSLSKLFRSFHL